MLDLQKAEAYLIHKNGIGAVIKQVELNYRPKVHTVYEGLLSSIISQQLSTSAAATIRNRFFDVFDGSIPHPEHLISVEPSELRKVGLSNQKASYIKEVACFFKENPIDVDYWTSFSDESIIQKLTEIKGVGRWTAEMILMFTLHRPDVLPVGDLGIQQGMSRLFNLNLSKKELHSKMKAIAEDWRPYRSVACLYLWQWKDAK